MFCFDIFVIVVFLIAAVAFYLIFDNLNLEYVDTTVNKIVVSLSLAALCALGYSYFFACGTETPITTSFGDQAAAAATVPSVSETVNGSP